MQIIIFLFLEHLDMQINASFVQLLGTFGAIQDNDMNTKYGYTTISFGNVPP